MCFILENLAITIFTAIPKNITNAVVVPNCCKAIETIASLLGTTPFTLNAVSNIPPKGSNDPDTTPAPADKTKNPTNVLTVPFTVSAPDFFCVKSPTKAIKETKNAGVFAISTKTPITPFIISSLFFI